MKLETALVIDTGVAGPTTHSLCSILKPYFQIEVRDPTVPNPEAINLDLELDKFKSKHPPALIFMNLSGSPISVRRKLIQSIKVILPDIPIIVVLDGGEPPLDILALIELGVTDFITAPLRASEVLPRALRWIKESDLAIIRATPLQAEFGQLIGESPTFLEQLSKIPTIANCDANVTLAGETGTGKELYSRAIHYYGARKNKPFVPVNCGAIPGDLVENELFGHERGAFTSASALHVGLIEEANGGTLFLDEIDCLPLYSQVKLLRFIQEKEYRPLGSAKMRRANVRIIAASNVDLQLAVEQGKVRPDLFYRLNTISLTLPPLRERRQDIPLLAEHFLEKYSRGSGKNVKEISRDALDLLMVQPWPGNIRELEHKIEQAIILCDGPVLNVRDFGRLSSTSDLDRESLQRAKAKEIARFEKNYVHDLLCACQGNITRAAQVAQKNRRSFWQLIQKHQIDVKKIKANAP